MWGGNNRQSSDYSFSAGSSQNFRNNDSYDFDISGDGDDYSFSSPEQKPRQNIQRSGSFSARTNVASSTGGYSSTGNSGGYGSSTLRRASIEDRAKEILEKARASIPKVTEDDSDNGPSLQATFAELLEGIDIPEERKSSVNVHVDITSPKVNTVGSKRSAETPGDTSYGDSFELSAADLEVGAFAAKRMREKSAERGRRMSFDQPNFREQKELSTFAKKSAASPDPAKSRKSLGDFQISTALSSIQRSKSFTGDISHHGEFAKYGSLERSDDEIYKMLNVTGAQDSMVASRSFLNSSATSSFIQHPSTQAAIKQTNIANNNTNNNFNKSSEQKPMGNVRAHNESFNSNDSYQSDEFHDSREELLSSPIPHLQRQTTINNNITTAINNADNKNASKKELDEDDGYYDDDFEADINSSAVNVTNKNDDSANSGNSADGTNIPRNNNGNVNTINGNVVNTPRSVSESHVPTKPGGENLNSVDEILQRWYNADTHTLMRSLDDIGRSRSQSTDLKPSVLTNNNNNKDNTSNNMNTSVVMNAPALSRSTSASTFVPLGPTSSESVTSESQIIINNNNNTNISGNVATKPQSVQASARSSPVTVPATNNINNSNYNNVVQNNAVTGIAMAKSNTDTIDGTPNNKESNNKNTASSALEIPTWDDADLLVLQQQYEENDTRKNGNEDNDYDNNSERYSDDKDHLSDNSYKSSVKNNNFNYISDTHSNRSKPLLNEDNNSIDRHSQQSKRSDRYSDNNNNNDFFTEKLKSINNTRKRNNNVKPSPSSVSDSDSNSNDSNYHSNNRNDNYSKKKHSNNDRRRKSYEEKDKENEEDSDNEDLKRYRRLSRSRSASPTRRSRSTASNNNNNINDKNNNNMTRNSLTYSMSLPKHPTHIPRLATSTKAKLIAKQQKQQQNHLENDTELQQLKKQSSQVLRKVFQLQDELFTLRRSQSLEKHQATHAESTSGVPLRHNQQSQLSLSDRYFFLKNEEEKQKKMNKKNLRIRRSLSPTATSTGRNVSQPSVSQDQSMLDALHLVNNDYQRKTNDNNDHDTNSSNIRNMNNYTNNNMNTNSAETVNAHSLVQELESVRFALSTPLPEDAEQEWSQLKRMLLSKATVLHKKEKELLTREKILALKEASVTQRETLLETRDTQDTETLLTVPLKNALSKIELLQSENDELKRQFNSINDELLTLKQSQYNNEIVENSAMKLMTEEKKQSDLRRHLVLEALQRLSLASKTYSNNNSKYRQYNNKNNENVVNNNNTTNEDTITVNKADYEVLLKDYAAQDMLLNGFQKENEKIVKQLQEKQRELQQIHANFFDERDLLNKELNSLRLMVPSVGTQSQNRHNLQQTLDSDCKIRDLTEKNRLLTQEISELRKQSLQTQDNLRQEILHLQQDLQSLQPEKIVFLKRSLIDKEKENSELMKRLERLATQCDTSGNLEEKIGVLRSTVCLLKQEILRRQVMTATQLQRLMTQAETLPFHQLIDAEQQLEKNSDNNHHMGAGHIIDNATAHQRNFADVKKIKELERTVRELQDALKKRFPDSVASLIHVNKIDDIQSQREAARLKLMIKELQQELEEQIHSSERRMIQLRTQQDTLRTHYETQLKQLQLELQLNQNNNNTHGEESDNLKTVKELELELKRSRSFYQRKIEELQRKHEMQLRALKRGNSDAFYDNNNNRNRNSEINNFNNNTSDDSQDTGVSHDCSDGDNETGGKQFQFQHQQKQFEERLSLLQKDLFSTTEELGRLKAENSRLLCQLQQLQQSQQPCVFNREDINNNNNNNNSNLSYNTVNNNLNKDNDVELLLERKLQLLKQSLQHAHLEEVKQLQDAQNETVTALRRSLDKLQIQQSQLQSQAVSSSSVIETNTNESVKNSDIVKELSLKLDVLENQLQNERQRCAALTNALLTLHQQNTSNNNSNNNINKTNDDNAVLTNETLLLRQIENLQRRFTIREQELTAVTQHLRTQHAMEIQRMQQLHEQEMRVKDEHLMRFKLELTQTITHLHLLQQQQKQDTINNTNTNINNVDKMNPINPNRNNTDKYRQRAPH